MRNRITVFNQDCLSKVSKLYKIELVKKFDDGFCLYHLIHKQIKDTFLVLPTNDKNSVCLKYVFDEISLFEQNHKNGNCYICVVPMKGSPVEACTQFNGKSFIHFVFLDYQKSRVVYDKNFYYSGSKRIKKLMDLCEQSWFITFESIGDSTMIDEAD